MCVLENQAVIISEKNALDHKKTKQKFDKLAYRLTFCIIWFKIKLLPFSQIDNKPTTFLSVYIIDQWKVCCVWRQSQRPKTEALRIKSLSVNFFNPW